jgi:1A family penicillin-binding protein
MGKTRPINNSKRSYLVLKRVLKFWRINQKSFSLISIKKLAQFNWLKWLLKRSPRTIRFKLPSLKIKLPTVKITLPSLPKRPATKKPVVIFDNFSFYRASRGWTFSPLLQLVKAQLQKSIAVQVKAKRLPNITLPQLPQTNINFSFIKKLRVAIAIVLLLSMVGGGFGVYALVFKDLPSPQQLALQDQIVTTRILDRNGEVLFKIYEDENRTIVKLDKIPRSLINATVAIEDKNFYHHHGFSVRGIVRAAIANSKDQTIQQGGSTITQQLIKNRLLTSEKTFQRKVREIVLSVMAEFTYSKDEILEMYFNQVAYGGSTYGVEEASERYFGKSVTELNLAESALLAGLPQAPSVYSPFGPEPETAKFRQQEVLGRMVDDGYITQQEADDALAQELTFRTDSIDIKAPHFVMYIRKLLAEQYGEEIVNQGGLEVLTTLDLPLQEASQKAVTAEVEKLTSLHVSNGAALVTNPQTGEILAMVGSTNYFDFAHDGEVNVTIRPRQPGSSIKPLTYATAMERGKTPNTIIDDSPITYHTAGSPPYSPKNYDGKFHGKVTLRESLGSSYNIPAVKTLAEVGIDSVIDKGTQMGIGTWQDRRRFGLSLTLGGGEVLMTDMAELYGTFANNGATVDLNPILEVKNYKGETLYRNTCVLDNKGCPKRQTLNPLVAYQITDILKDNKARTPAFGPRSVLYIPNQEVAVKTGTTNNLRDNWTIGYTTDRLAAVWVGNNDSTSMSYVASGITGASPIWNNIIRLTLSDEHPHKFATPSGMIKVQVCTATGTLPCQGCPAVSDALFAPGTEPTKQCSPTWFQKNPTTGQTKTRDKILNGTTTTTTQTTTEH